MSRSTRILSSAPYHDGAGWTNQLNDNFGAIPTPTSEQAHAARLYVAGHAHDVDDARLLLTALGLGDHLPSVATQAARDLLAGGDE